MRLPHFLIDHPDGEIRLKGHRIGLFHVVDLDQEGYSAHMIAQHFPSLSLDEVKNAIAFYRENRAEVDAYVAAYRADLERHEAETPRGGPSRGELLRRRDAERRAGAA